MSLPDQIRNIEQAVSKVNTADTKRVKAKAALGEHLKSLLDPTGRTLFDYHLFHAAHNPSNPAATTAHRISRVWDTLHQDTRKYWRKHNNDIKVFSFKKYKYRRMAHFDLEGSEAPALALQRNVKFVLDNATEDSEGCLIAGRMDAVKQIAEVNDEEDEEDEENEENENERQEGGDDGVRAGSRVLALRPK